MKQRSRGDITPASYLLSATLTNYRTLLEIISLLLNSSSSIIFLVYNYDAKIHCYKDINCMYRQMDLFISSS